ncbi:acyl dehydratase [Pseudochelatococcus lubricantis]|uniref:Acyl dehydratase n=1 Tax=Pseudochelatococcus lubricantis TaxID=1538102 RepID=A0ABX0V1R4_9HYPH|nr:MaoC family dehydratase [Pseudochelatococcus lubricantis]NIJ59148.1 acyl dehydratase [Pseudochelatococcus lubricantis]
MIRQERGLLYEDFSIGQQFEHHWGRTFNASDASLFSNMFLQMNPIFFNAPYAQALGYDDIIVPPMFVFATILGLSVEDLSEAGGPFLGVDDLSFGVPVHAGDTVYARSTVVSQRLTESRPGWGITEWHTRGHNQNGEEVVTFHRRNLSRCRNT